ncbi:MAG: NAD(P)H-dependent flavin oxidoreductase [Candidatus Jordarchaeum sp.]|uniref:NAD(P)H-dependent flavin oxidoreductase n=1 Tax=Candidatus Jordarchaeum sp. TaxID=2823881 RepID=UPI0040492434
MALSIKTELCDLLGIKYPIIQAGMGPYCTVNLAAAVSNAGALGTVSIPGMTVGPEVATKKIREYIHTVKKNTKNNFAVNTPVGENVPEVMLKTTDAYVSTVIEERENDRELRKRMVLYITSAGNPVRYHKRIKDSGMLHFHVTPSAYHAKKMEKMGLDGVIASGYEAGGHTHRADRIVHTFVLIPSVTDAVKIPVVAAGGMCDAKTLVAALALGAQGIQMGTRFLVTKESDFHSNYKQFIVDAGEWSDMVGTGVYGPARCLRNKGAIEILKLETEGTLSEEELTKLKDEKLWASERDGDVVNGLIGAGQVASRIDSMLSVRDVIESIMHGATDIIKKLNGELR